MVGTGSSRPRIGVPRSILHYEFDGAIERFLRRLGMDVVLSPPTNHGIFQAGKRVVIDELCFPIKIFVGHVAHLAEQDVDRIVVPTVVGHTNKHVFPCHPRSRLADIVRALGVCDTEQLLAPAFRFDRDGLTADGFRELARTLGFTDAEADRALPERRVKLDRALEARQAGDGLTLALIGHPYVVDDPWANNQVIRRLERLGCRVVTNLETTPIGYAPEGTGLHFALAARTVTLARTFDREPEVDGIVFLLPFNCGPDGDIARHLTQITEKPMLTLVLDELQSSAGMITRLEAFIDLLSCSSIPVGGRAA
jgi:predicted nucleotide-binding protein (sugar kinase/HSP70/actin superfamily)